MACIPPTVNVVPCPPCPPVVPTVPPGVPCYQVPPQQVCVPPVQPGQASIPVKLKKCKYIQPARPKSYAPVRKFLPPETEMSDHTVYRKSYLPCEIARGQPFLPLQSICLGEGKFSGDTVNKMSFKGYKDVLPACPIMPCNHKLLGDGPMQDITTNRHDYVKKQKVPQNKIVPQSSLTTSDCPLSDQTTNRLSYMPVCADRVKAKPPKSSIEPGKGPFETRTTQRMSYMPCMAEPIDMPWAEKKKFIPPKLRMADDTTNRMSYKPPGIFIECEDPSDPCCTVPCPEDPCAPSPPPAAPPCCAPCCCPRAAC